MGIRFKHFAIFVIYSLTKLSITNGDSYSVQVATEEHVNLVDSKFLSFTVDPKYLLSSSEKYNNKECICMATSLAPAYIRIAGPSTSLMSFKNTTISLDDGEPQKLTLSKLYSEETGSGYYKTNLAVARRQWKKFVQWAKNTGFELVLAFNNDEKTATGIWDPNTALHILTAADKENIGEMFWQLGYECTNQSIEEYLNDLETLRVIVETFPLGKAGRWQVVGGDVTHCLQADSKSDFKDYVTLSNDMMDAILLNGNSSSRELERMSERDRYKLLKLLSTSDTPLWLTEHSHMISELDRAADWMTSLGYSARNGFSVHYRELMEKELYEPSLSFYMALLFKNLVGERVLNVDIEASQAILFAHCTSLRRKPVSGAVTFYGANMDEEPARFSIKMSKKEDGGDIMQFILGHDRNGNIVVNGRPMYYEGDIRPVVKRVRPFKTLLVNLPPKSFGFWVLANTLVQACYNVDKENNNIIDNTISVNSSKKDDDNNLIKTKRSPIRKTRSVYSTSESEDMINDNVGINLNDNEALKNIINNINKDLNEAKRIFFHNNHRTWHNRSKRHILEEDSVKQNKASKIGKLNLFNGFHYDVLKNNINKLLKLPRDHVTISKHGKLKSLRHKISKDKPKRYLKRDLLLPFKKDKTKSLKLKNNEITVNKNELGMGNLENSNLIRKRRSANPKNILKHERESFENEIDIDDKETLKLGGILNKLKKLGELPLEIQEKDDKNDYEEHESMEGIVLKTKVTDNSAVIDIGEKSHTGLLKSTLQDILALLADFNKNINRFWTAITILE